MPRKSSTTAVVVESTPATGTDASADTAGIDQFELPKSLITRIAKSSVPADVKLQKEMPLALVKSSTIFINYLAALSHDVAHEKSNKTISAAHVLEAIKELGWDDQAELSKLLHRELNAFRQKAEDKKNGIVPSAPASVTKGAAGERKTRGSTRRKSGVAAARESTPPPPSALVDDDKEAEANRLKVVQENGTNAGGEPDEEAYQTGDEEEEEELDLPEDEDEDEEVPKDEDEEVPNDEDEDEAEDGAGLQDDPMQEDDE